MSEKSTKKKTKPILARVGGFIVLFALLFLPLIGLEKAFFEGEKNQETFRILALIGGEGEMWEPAERTLHVHVTATVICVSSILGLLGGLPVLRLCAGVAGLGATLVLLLPAFFAGDFFVPYLVLGSYALIIGCVMMIVDGLVGIVAALPKDYWEFRMK